MSKVNTNNKKTLNKKKTTISFVSINARYSHSNLSALYLRQIIKQLNYDFKHIEFDIHFDVFTMLEKIIASKPSIVAFSVYIWNKEIIKQLIPEIKKTNLNIKIILGGPEVSYNHKTWLKYFPDIDFIIIGSGEKAFFSILKNGNVFKRKNKIVKIKNYKFNNIPFPYIESDFSKLLNKYIYYESSRGCSFKCSYCLSSIDSQFLEYRDTNKVIKEIDFLLKFSPKIIKFVDRTFNFKPSHYRKIWIHLIKLNTKTTFHFEIYPDLLQDEDFKILEKSKNFQFEIGVQSLNKKTLKNINRNENFTALYTNIKKLIKLNNIHIHIGLIAGLPYDTLSSFKKTFNKTYQLNPGNLQLGFLKVLPGTRMEKDNEKFKLKYFSSNNYHIIENKWISFQEISLLKRIEVLLNSIHNTQKFLKTDYYLNTIFKTPYAMYENLVKFIDTNTNISHFDWIQTATIIKDYIKLKYPEHFDLIMDALRFDWTLIASSNYYPPFLNYKNFNEIITIKHKIKNKLKNENSFNEIGNSAFNKSIIFIPQSKTFIQKENLAPISLIFIKTERILKFEEIELK